MNEIKAQDQANVEEPKGGVSDDGHSLVINMPIKKPILVNGKEIFKLKIDFTNMTGADILSVDKEMRLEGHPAGFDSIFNQEVLLKLTSRVTGVLPDDLSKMHGADFLEVLLQVRNFFIQW